MTRPFLPFRVTVAVHDEPTQSATILYQHDAVSLRSARVLADAQRQHYARLHDASAITCTITDTLTARRIY